MENMSNGKNGSSNKKFQSRKRKNQTEIGILEWFHLNDHKHVEQFLNDIEPLGIKHLRTGVSWADYHTPEGEQWYDWLIPKLSEKVEILPCFLYTPPSLGIVPKTSSPPREPKLYADFLDIFINRHGEYFEWVELWNEPNNRSEYDYTLDHSWEIFIEMINMAGFWSKKLGKKTLLGGMSPIDMNWLEMMIKAGVIDHMDAIGIHGFPKVFETYWEGWDKNIAAIKKMLKKNNCSAEVWITETGFSTWQHDERKQLEEFLKAKDAPTNRIYWYCMRDLSESRPTVDGFHLDEREYHFGLKSHAGNEKLLYRLLKQSGIKNIGECSWISHQQFSDDINYALITGGAGFVGVNLADRLLENGHPVMILDNLSRPGVEDNLKWLYHKHPENLQFRIADIRNSFAVKDAVEHADTVYHFAGQVAVTTSLKDPLYDFEVNAKGSLNILEAIRKSDKKPPLIFTSTNKVYGALEDLRLKEYHTRFEPTDKKILNNGISEDHPLDFHSPYGSSKGAAEQYILDYARSYGLQTSVFRMSCIYGPHQCGTEDQGWVAHFLINALENKKVNFFGNGKQVRDILFVDDLINAFLTASENMDKISGQVFNIGGGVSNTVSLCELVDIINVIHNTDMEITYHDWRTGDQKYYVTDISKFQKATGWKPEVNMNEGVERLYRWMRKNLYRIKGKGSMKFKKEAIL